MSHDPLIDLAVSLFMQWVGEDLVGAPFVELHDVIDPNVGVDIALDRAAEKLGVSYITEGEPWYALCSAVAEAYDERAARLLEI